MQSLSDEFAPAARREVILSTHPFWEYILGPGKAVWYEPSDNGKSRVAFPFTLAQRNANCAHNGLMTYFLFDGSSASHVFYQIGAETCLYFKANLWGMLPTIYTPGVVSSKSTILGDLAAEVAARMETRRPIEQITADFAPEKDIDPAAFANANGVSPQHMTAYGLIYNGVHYVGGYETRY